MQLRPDLQIIMERKDREERARREQLDARRERREPRPTPPPPPDYSHAPRSYPLTQPTTGLEIEQRRAYATRLAQLLQLGWTAPEAAERAKADIYATPKNDSTDNG